MSLILLFTYGNHVSPHDSSPFSISSFGEFKYNKAVNSLGWNTDESWCTRNIPFVSYFTTCKSSDDFDIAVCGSFNNLLNIFGNLIL